ncbi:MAG: cysteine desulfurase [Anaerolineae bacterium]|nr:cysteine desulfurase [Anaerolineae bacterium]NUQ02596.1 cysteine desulfurase [Anaerolineae bacterium]
MPSESSGGALDVAGLRSDFPVLQQEHHPGVPLVYLDNAATTQKPNAVIETMSDYYRRYNANVHRGIHKLSEEATAAYETARVILKRFINAGSKREIVFTRGTTEGINLVSQTWGRANLNAGDVVLLTEMEHHSNIVPWQLLSAERGLRLRYTPIRADGALDMEAFRKLLQEEPVKLVGFMFVSNVLGTINAAQEMIRLAHEAGATVLVDAAQAVPHQSIDVQALDCDFLVFSGHKMLGPTGSGVLYGKRALLEAMPPWMGGGDMISRVSFERSEWNELPYKFEAGTPSIAEAIGLGAAVEYLNRVGMAAIHRYEQEIIAYALERLTEVPGLHLVTPERAPHGAVATFTLQGIHAHDVAQVLDAHGVAIRAGHHCAMPLHERLGLNATARASFYFYNTLEEVDCLVAGIYAAKQTFSV